MVGRLLCDGRPDAAITMYVLPPPACRLSLAPWLLAMGSMFSCECALRLLQELAAAHALGRGKRR